jgi:hypothetical protein
MKEVVLRVRPLRILLAWVLFAQAPVLASIVVGQQPLAVAGPKSKSAALPALTTAQRTVMDVATAPLPNFLSSDEKNLLKAYAQSMEKGESAATEACAAFVHSAKGHKRTAAQLEQAFRWAARTGLLPKHAQAEAMVVRLAHKYQLVADLDAYGQELAKARKIVLQTGKSTVVTERAVKDGKLVVVGKVSASQADVDELERKWQEEMEKAYEEARREAADANEEVKEQFRQASRMIQEHSERETQVVQKLLN